MFLQHYLRGADTATSYSDVFVDLNGDGTAEVIVYVTGQRWCESSGCVMLVLERKGLTYRVVTRTTITRPPIRVLTSSSHGWHNIGVWVQGGGTQPGYEAELRFDGKTYPGNPSMPPARRLIKTVPGKIVVREAGAGKPLYP